MSDYVEVIVIVEGKTEVIFIKKILGEYLALKNIYMIPTQISTPGKKGGDVKFSVAIKDISNYLKQRNDTYVSTFFDYYGIRKGWPGLAEARRKTVPSEIASVMNSATKNTIDQEISDYQLNKRFISYIAVHEFESLLFSDPTKIASTLDVKDKKIQKIIDEFGDPEKINNSSKTAPSKRLEKLYPGYKKAITGIDIAEDIGIPKMREKCKVFDRWLRRLEELKPLVKEDSL